LKPIGGSVGVTGKNNSRDVMIFQYLLNYVPAVKGGPGAELAVDGICGPLTCAAIGKFQKKQIGWGDGCVDPNGKNIASLNNFDPYPAHNPFAGGAGGTVGGKPGKSGTGFGVGKQDSGGGQDDFPGQFGKQTGFGGGGSGGGSKQPGGSPGGGSFPSKFGGKQGW